MSLALFFVLLLACYGCSYSIMHRLAQLHARSYFLLRLVLLPGVIVHETAHVIGCLATFTPIEHISFWDEQGGHVLHHKPKMHLIAQPIISLAPLPIGLGLLLLISQQLPAQQWVLTIIYLFLMMSIAGTLAPSKTDLQAAIAGIAGLIIIGGGIIAAYPVLLQDISPFFTSLNQKMLFIFFILLAMAATLWVLHRIRSIRFA